MADKDKNLDGTEPEEEQTGKNSDQPTENDAQDSTSNSDYIDPYADYYESDDTKNPENESAYYTDRHPYYEDSLKDEKQSEKAVEESSSAKETESAQADEEKEKSAKEPQKDSASTLKNKKKSDADDKKMPFLAHLEELRWTIVRSLIAIVLASIVAFFFADQIMWFLRSPAPADLKLIYLSPTEGFMMYLKVSMFAGLVLALPYVAWEVWKFVVPGLLDKERKLVLPIVFFTVLCFAAGATFAYLVILRFGLNFLLTFADPNMMEANLTIGKYLGFCVTIILVFGVVFELPVMAFFLSSIGILHPNFLRKYRKHGIVVIFIVAAMLTPPDVVTQLLLAGPLILLYEISVWVSAVVARKRKESEVEEEE